MIRTENLALIGFDFEQHKDAIHRWLNDDENTKFMLQGHRPVSYDDIKKWYGNPDDVVFMVRSGEMIGVVGLYGFNNPARSAELRVILDKTMHGEGFGTEAVLAVVAFAFRNLNLHRVWLGVNAENAGAIRCYEKAGFKKEGVLKDEIFRNNRYFDVVRMAVIL